MSIEGPTKVTISKDVLAQEVSGETVLLDLASEQYFGLNEVGTRVWQLIGDGLNMGEVLDALLSEFDVDQRQLEADVDQLIYRLMDAGLVTLNSPESKI